MLCSWAWILMTQNKHCGMPLILLGFFIVDFLSIAYPFIAYYLWRQWNTYNNTINDDYAHRCLYGAIALLLLIVLGRFLMKAILSKRRKGEDEPHFFQSTKSDSVKRPDGSIIN